MGYIAAFDYLEVYVASSVTYRPSIPPITIESAVINWFLNHDKHLNGLRANFPDQVAAVAADIQKVLNDAADGRSLHATVTNISEFFVEYTPAEIALYQRGAPFSDDEWKFLFTCELAGAKMRILGYFLKEKYGIDPTLADQGSTEGSERRVTCEGCGKINRIALNAPNPRCGHCGTTLPLTNRDRNVQTELNQTTASGVRQTSPITGMLIGFAALLVIAVVWSTQREGLTPTYQNQPVSTAAAVAAPSATAFSLSQHDQGMLAHISDLTSDWN